MKLLSVSSCIPAVAVQTAESQNADARHQASRAACGGRRLEGAPVDARPVRGFTFAVSAIGARSAGPLYRLKFYLRAKHRRQFEGEYGTH